MAKIVPSDTPLAKAMRHLKITQVELARRLGVQQSSVSRIVRYGRISAGVSADMAERIATAIARPDVIDERHILYPHRYPDWAPPAVPTAD